MPNDVRIRITRVVDPDDMVRQITPNMRNLGEAIGARAQRLVPKRTWALHDTITADTQRVGNTVVTTVSVGSEDVGYWEAVEKGTSKMNGQPYLRPAFMQTTNRDLNYDGKGVVRHGVVEVISRRERKRRTRQRACDRAADRRTSKRKNGSES